MFQTLALFFVGFFILIKGVDYLVTGSVAFARFLRVSGWVIGVVVTGIGTSIPEFGITVFSALRGEAAIGLGTIIGSNTYNILFILGLSALVAPLSMKADWVRRGVPPGIFAAAIAAACAVLPVAGDPRYRGITGAEGAIMLFLFLGWLGYVMFRKRFSEEDEATAKLVAIPIAFLMVGAGFIGVLVGARWVVDGAVAIAQVFGASEAFIGLTILSIGTSIPELAVSVGAALRKHPGIAVGNVVGSNVFDFLGILGVAALFRPLPFAPGMVIDIAVTIGSASLLLLLLLWRQRYVFTKGEGAFFMALYFAYLGFLLWRG